MRYNLYIPNRDIKEKWEKYAKEDGRSLAQFIRLAVNEKIQRMIQKETQQ